MGTEINTVNAFFALLRAGLWEREDRLSMFGDVDYKKVYDMANYQAVKGLLAAGIDHINDYIIPKDEVLLFVGSALQIEKHNVAMNCYINALITGMRNNGIYSILLKGKV